LPLQANHCLLSKGVRRLAIQQQREEAGELPGFTSNVGEKRGYHTNFAFSCKIKIKKRGYVSQDFAAVT
jgi:hypothetical protein